MYLRKSNLLKIPADSECYRGEGKIQGHTAGTKGKRFHTTEASFRRDFGEVRETMRGRENLSPSRL